jgi:hypothetical protein
MVAGVKKLASAGVRTGGVGDDEQPQLPTANATTAAHRIMRANVGLGTKGVNQDKHVESGE